jgi:uracil-DNA glycosylase family protein
VPTSLRTKPRTRSAADFFPPRITLPALRDAAAGCRGCDLYRHATQVVFGEGKRGARIVLIGEIPGNQEDKAGRPFIGPAGQLLRRALIDAGVPLEAVYITNAVKHFKWSKSGERRVGEPPDSDEIRACLPWLEAEIAVIRPRVLSCLGASAARAVLGRNVLVREARAGLNETPFGISAFVTVHPSSLLRAGQSTDKARAYRHFVADLKRLRHCGME